MAAPRDYYEVLGVSRDVSSRDIATAYRKLAIKYHPDSNSDDENATEKFKEAATAFEVLNDAEKRALYDQFGHAGVDGSGGGGAHFNDVEDVFEAFGDMFGGGVFGDLFGRRGRGRHHRGADIRADVTLDLEEAALGVTKTLKFAKKKLCDTCGGDGSQPGSKPETCSRCRGQGKVVQSAGILRVQTTCPACGGAGKIISSPCPDCRGAGMVGQKTKLEVAIPAGVDDGMRVRLTGEGDPSPDGGPPGDCYCFIRVREHQFFERDGQSLILRLPITYTQAALGATVEVPTLVGRQELKIPAGTQSGEVFRMRGFGMPDPHRSGKGDLLVQTRI